MSFAGIYEGIATNKEESELKNTCLLSILYVLLEIRLVLQWVLKAMTFMTDR